jgi:hypothetical protein
MNLVHQSPQAPRDDLDGLLRTFFRAQMPHPWPAAPATTFRLTPALRPATSRRPLMRSRWALAASIGLLLLGSLLLPGRFAPVSKLDQGIDGPGVSDRMFQKNMNKEHLKKQQQDNKADGGVEDGGELPDLE